MLGVISFHPLSFPNAMKAPLVFCIVILMSLPSHPHLCLLCSLNMCIIGTLQVYTGQDLSSYLPLMSDILDILVWLTKRKSTMVSAVMKPVEGSNCWCCETAREYDNSMAMMADSQRLLELTAGRVHEHAGNEGVTCYWDGTQPSRARMNYLSQRGSKTVTR